MDRDGTTGIPTPSIVSAKEQLDITHEVNTEVGLERRFKPEFDGVTGAEIAHVININGHVKGRFARERRTMKKAGCMGTREETQEGKKFPD
jgi:hypothetical protein